MTEQTEQTERRTVVTVELDPELLQWLKRQSANRLLEGRPHGERSMGAVVRDLIAEAREKEAVAA